MYKFSKREKLLIYLCLLLAIVIGGLYALILPAADRMMALKQDLLEQEIIVSEAKTAIALYPQMQVEVGKLEAKVAEAEENFYPYADNERLEAFVTQLLLKHNLTPTVLLMADSGATLIAPYQPQADMEEDAAETVSGPILYSNIIHIEASGTEARILAFLAEMEGISYARVANVTLSIDDTVTPVAPAIVNLDDPAQPALAGRELYAMISADIAIYLY